MTEKIPPTQILRVALPVPIHQCFDYLPNQACSGVIQPGMRVLAPFGRRTLVGIVIKICANSGVEAKKLRAIEQVIDQKPILDVELFELGLWAQQYYHHPIGETFSTMLPNLLRQNIPACISSVTRWQAKTDVSQAQTQALQRSPVQTSLLKHLQSNENGLNAQQLNDIHPHWRRAINALCEKELIQAYEEEILPPKNIANQLQAPPLNTDQQLAIETLSKHLAKFDAWLLEGVTGSGKTEVYIQIIQTVINHKQQALVMIPEIGLSPQLLSRFRERLNARIAVLHSGLNDRERLNNWLLAQQGELDVIIGTRSAIFTPLLKPGIIIIDEEHDGSFKQQDGLRYHARDLAVFRAKKLNIPIVLGSATPSLESLNNVQRDRYQLLSLPKRVSNIKPPRISVIDMRKAAINEAFSVPLIEAMRAHLERKQQVLLFLNRRGYSPTLICHDCGWTSACARCDAQMTYHQRRKRLQCHHCGSERAAELSCPSCEGQNLFALGAGTERIEEQIERLFKNQRIVRIDRDTTRRKGELEKSLALANSGEANILIGTQMLAKGHHFPNVSLVGIIDIDQGLFSADFRGPEYMAQLIVQVAGRAGRQSSKHPKDIPQGEVLIQTHQPEHPLLKILITKGYHEFAQQTLQERNCAELPPFTHIALLRTESTANKGLELLSQVKESLSPIFKKPNTLLLGPAPAPMERRAGRYRAHLMLQAEHRQDLHQMLNQVIETLQRHPHSKTVRWSIDVDPSEIF